MLRSRYALLGPEKMAKLLPGRTVPAIRFKALSMGLFVGDIEGHVPLSFISDATGLNINSVRERAERHGVTRKLKSKRKHTFKILVPEAWAEAYIRAADRAQEAAELKGHYYNLRKTARIFGVDPSTIRGWLYGRYPGAYGNIAMSRIRTLTSTGRHRREYLFDPYDVEREAKIYRDKREATNTGRVFRSE